MTSDGIHRQTRYKRLAAWLGLCAVLFLQVQIASHAELEHASSGSHEGICEVCLKLDKSGSVPLTVAAATTVGHEASTPAFRSALLFPTWTKNPHFARGPPAA